MKAARVLCVLAALFAGAHGARAADAQLYCLTGTSSTGAPLWQPVSPSAPCPVTATVSASVAVAPLTSTNLSGTISVTNTFQSIQVATAGRNGCNIQSTGTHTQWVFFGAIGGATEAKGFQLSAGQTISCAVGGIGVLTDQISITGTSGDTFVANVQ